jgi:Chaperone of endosialidase
MGGGTTKQDTQSQSVTQIPQWMQQAGQQNYAYAQDVAARPLQQYQGQMVSDVAPQTQQAWNLAASSGNVGQDQYGASTAGYLGALGQTPASVTAGQLSNTNLQPYMNPYTQSVINATLPIMQQQLGQQQIGNQSQAAGAGAYGGSRQAIQQGVTQAQGAMGMGQMAAQLNQANFGQAQSAAQQDIANRLTASTANQTAQQNKINSDILASQGLMNTGNALNQANMQNYNMLTSAGAGQSMQAQNQINAQMAKFQQAQQYPQQQLATLLSALGMTPHDTSTTGAQQTQTTTPTDWANILAQSLGAGATIFQMSDVKAKKDVVSLGPDPATGVPVKSFRFKGQKANAPKIIGPLAQDVEKAMPGSTSSVGGFRGMPRSTMIKATPTAAALPNFAARMPSPMGVLGRPKQRPGPKPRPKVLGALGG